jgi:hypothetical protein
MIPALFTITSSRNGAATPALFTRMSGLEKTKGVLVLADLIGRADTLELHCDRCGCRGRLSVARLAREHPPETPLPRIMRAHIGDCPNRNAQQKRERCDPYSPTLLRLFAGL